METTDKNQSGGLIFGLILLFCPGVTRPLTWVPSVSHAAELRLWDLHCMGGPGMLIMQLIEEV